MKKTVLLLLSIFALASCSSDDTTTVANPSNPQPDPNLLTSVVFWPENPTSKQVWSFDDNGYLTIVKDAQGNVMQEFFYDAHHNLTSCTQGTQTFSFTYDTNDKITTVNGAAFQFDASTNSYFQLFGQPDPNEEELTVYKRQWTVNADLFVTKQTDYLANMYEQTMSVRAVMNYENGNLQSFYDTDAVFSHYTFDNKTNPLKHATAPITRAMSLTSGGYSPNFSQMFVNGLYNSANNPVTLGAYSEDPETNEYDYAYNANGFPTTAVTKSFYFGVYEGETPFIEYHYQGDAQ